MLGKLLTCPVFGFFSWDRLTRRHGKHMTGGEGLTQGRPVAGFLALPDFSSLQSQGLSLCPPFS